MPILIFLLAFLFAFKCITDIDIWWHLAAGKWLAENLDVIRSDPFSYTFNGKPWTSITWGYELLNHFSLQFMSYGGVVFLHAIAAGASGLMAYFVYRQLDQQKSARKDLLFFLILIPALFAVNVRWAFRPEMFSHALLLSTLWAWLKFAQAQSVRSPWFWTVLGLQIFWVNMHGLFTLGPFVGACVILTFFLCRDRLQNTMRSMLILWGSQLAVCLLNPRGLHGFLWPWHLLQLLTHPFYQTTIPEGTKPFRDSVWAFDAWTFALTLLISIGLVGIYLWRNRSQLRLREPALILFVCGALPIAWTAFNGRRNIAVFILWCLPFVALFLARELSTQLERLEAHFSSRRLRHFIAAIMFMISLGLVTNFFRPQSSNTRFGSGLAFASYPLGAAKFLKTRFPQERVFNNVEMGDFLLHAQPGFQTYIDGRFAEVYSQKHFQHYMELLVHPQLLEAESKIWKFDLVAVTYEPPLIRNFIQALAESKDWKILFLDGEGIVLGKAERFKDFPDWDDASVFTVMDERRREQESQWYNFLNWHWPEDEWREYLSLAEAGLIVGRSTLVKRALNSIPEGARQSSRYLAASCMERFFHLSELAKSGPLPEIEVGGALEVCETAVAKDPYNLSSRQTLGLIFYNAGDFGQAHEQFEKVVALEPSNFQGHLMAGQAYLKLKDARALHYFSEAARLRPYDYQILEWWAQAALELKSWGDAREAYQRLYEATGRRDAKEWMERLDGK